MFTSIDNFSVFYHINSQTTSYSQLLNMTSQSINRTTMILIAPILLNNSTITQQQYSSSTTYHSNKSTKSNPYKTLINLHIFFLYNYICKIL